MSFVGALKRHNQFQSFGKALETHIRERLHIWDTFFVFAFYYYFKILSYIIFSPVLRRPKKLSDVRDISDIIIRNCGFEIS